ncbi:MAG: RNA-binding protein [Candidatus Omnitrophica bacterium]|nr:RNA-binding protein [Candidatus Omnitrophota bacterium]
MNIFVGNLSFDATETDMQQAFAGFGKVSSAVIVKEKNGVKSRGFGFVDMPDEQEALAAILALNNKEFMGRLLNVSPARPKSESDRLREYKKKMRLKLEKSAQSSREDKERKAPAPAFIPDFKRRGRYKTGRRALSFIAKNKEGLKEKPKPWRKNAAESKIQKKATEAKRGSAFRR